MVTNMKHTATSKPFFSPDQAAAALEAAPDHVVDADAPSDWQGAVISHSLPQLREQLAVRRRGPGRAANKVPTTIRFDADVLAALKASGKGWQTRVNEMVKEWLKTHSPT